MIQIKEFIKPQSFVLLSSAVHLKTVLITYSIKSCQCMAGVYNDEHLYRLICLHGRGNFIRKEIAGGDLFVTIYHA